MYPLILTPTVLAVATGSVDFTPLSWAFAPLLISAGLVFLFLATSAWIEHVDHGTRPVDRFCPVPPIKKSGDKR